MQGGTQLGYAPLRHVLQERMAQLDIVTQADQIVLTTGVTHALDLVVRTLVRPGEPVMTFDPCWFGTHGLLASHGARVLGVPCGADGPDFAAMEQLAQRERPRLLVVSSAAHNPTGLCLSAQQAGRILKVAAQFDMQIFEDDVYADLCTSKVTRLAAALREARRTVARTSRRLP
ncbi:MAG: aminotransferase class I/II-fold pyridoxal phosphate-dependent enzyme [Steroidobacteraceae bacterium]